MSLRLGIYLVVLVAACYLGHWARSKARDWRVDRDERESERLLHLMVLREKARLRAREFVAVDYDALDDEELTVDIFERWFNAPCAPDPRWLIS